MKKICGLFFITLMLLSANVIAVYAQQSDMALYNQKLNDDINKTELNELKGEILSQAKNILAGAVRNNIESQRERDTTNFNIDPDSFDITKAVKMISVEGNLIEQMDSISNVISTNLNGRSNDLYNDISQSYIWKVPVCETEGGYVFSSVKINSSEDIICWTTLVNNKDLSDATYLFNQELILNILDESGMNVNFETVLPVTLASISTDYIYFMADDKEYAIVFSSRPDFLGVENGEIYEYAQMQEKVDNLLDEMSTNSDMFLASGGGGTISNGGSWVIKPPLELYLAIAVAICGVVFIHYVKVKRSSK